MQRFTKQFGGTYICCVCGKRTREIGLGESDLELCAYCYEIAGLENQQADGKLAKVDIVRELARIMAAYKRSDYVDGFSEDVVRLAKKVI